MKWRSWRKNPPDDHPSGLKSDAGSVIAERLSLTLLHDPPVAIRLGRDRFMPLDPIDD